MSNAEVLRQDHQSEAILRAHSKGVVSFEYLIVAARVVAAVAAAFGTGGAKRRFA